MKITRFENNSKGFILVVILYLFCILAYANLDFGVNRRRSDLSALAYNAYIGLEKVNRVAISKHYFSVVKCYINNSHQLLC